jgi:hypothetical protein
MNTALQSVIDSAKQLSPVEQLELLKIISHALQLKHFFKVAAWQVKNFEEILQTSPTKPVHTLAELAADFWPAEESADDIIEYLYQQRREDRVL